MVVLFFLGGCTPDSPAQDPTAVTITPPGEQANEKRSAEPKTAYQVALDDARSERQKVMEDQPPEYRGDGSREQSLEYLNGEWMQWAEVKRDRASAVEDIYSGMLDLADSDKQLVELHADLVEMRVIFWEELLRSVQAAMPDSHKNDPKLSRAFLEGFMGSVESLRLRARELVENCRDVTERGGVTTVAATKCLDFGQRLGPDDRDQSE